MSSKQTNQQKCLRTFKWLAAKVLAAAVAAAARAVAVAVAVAIAAAFTDHQLAGRVTKNQTTNLIRL